EEFNFGAYLRLRDGRLAFGGPGGFNIFDPTRLTENRRPPHVALTRVEVLGAPAPGPKPYWLLERIDLGYRANILSLDFGALDFASPKRNRLAYRMTGLTDRWLDLGTQRRITLTNIESGDHLLEVRAANSDSVWSGTPLKLTIHRDPPPRKSWWACLRSARVLLQIVNDLLDLSKINAGKIALEVLPFDLGQVLEECSSLFAGAAQAKGIELIVSPPPPEHCSLRGDALRVRQILMNLIGNAVKFTARGEVLVRAEVRAATTADCASVEISVSDTGIGIDAATIGRIFEPFTQADESTSRRFGGSGLGLAICRELTQLMRGSLSVESRP